MFPTFHWKEIPRDRPAIDYIVRGEGEEVALNLVTALAAGQSAASVAGLALRVDGAPTATDPAVPIADLDRCRVAWELMEDRHYTYWGGRKAVVVQFSRGCP